MRHFRPIEADGKVGLNTFDGIFSNFKRFAWQRDIDFVRTVAMIFVNVVVATQTISIG